MSGQSLTSGQELNAQYFEGLYAQNQRQIAPQIAPNLACAYMSPEAIQAGSNAYGSMSNLIQMD